MTLIEPLVSLPDALLPLLIAVGFFWKCSCCGPDFFLLTTEHIIGKNWGTTTGDNVWSTAHGLASQGGRKQMSADADFVWICGPISGSQTIQKYNSTTGALDSSIAVAATNGAQPNGIARDQNGNFGIGGLMSSPTERFRYLDASGAYQWGFNSGANVGGWVTFNADDELLCYFNTTGGLRKFDSSGSVIWDSTTTDIPSALGHPLQFDLEGNILLGTTGIGVEFSKYDGDGNFIWTDTGIQCAADAVAVGPNNEFVIGGPSSVTPGASRIIRFDEDGNELDSDTITGFTLRGIAIAPDGRVVAVGVTTGLTPNVGIGYTWEADWTPGASFEYLDAASGDAIGSVIWSGGLQTPWHP